VKHHEVTDVTLAWLTNLTVDSRHTDLANALLPEQAASGAAYALHDVSCSGAVVYLIGATGLVSVLKKGQRIWENEE